VKSIPLVGGWLLQVLRGGTDVTINTLYRFFAFHVVVLPLAAFGMIAVHLLFVQRQGMAPPLGATVAPRGMRFFPNFFLRDVLLWLACLLALLLLAAFLPYGPSIPGMEWDLGRKADPLAPAYPGIKPEWYFLWVYQLLKEFPPHVLGLEGPQLCLLVVCLLLGVWAVIPWIDRNARRDRPSPAFTDLGVAALLFIGLLTLKAWDVGVSADVTEPIRAELAARHAAGLVLAVFVVVTTGRALAARRWFIWSGAAAAHAALHGLAGVSYLAAGALSAGAAAVVLLVARSRPAAAQAVEGERR
jgi:quinol-cytochrome oxidoreductase complex cytochrome b subunit